MIGYICILILIIILLIIFYIISKKDIKKYKKEILILKESKIEEIENKYKDETKKIKQFYDLKKKESQKDFQNEINKFAKENQNKINDINNQINFLEQKLNSKKKEYHNLLIHQEELLRKDLKIFEDEERRKINNTLNLNIAQKNLDFQKFSEKMNERRENLTREISEIEESLNEYRNKQNSINEAILRSRQLEEQQDFYKLQLPDNDIEDIRYVNQFKDNFHNKEMLNRAIYDTYIKKPYSELVKRIFQGRKVSCIYKITYIPTGEIYVGKAVDGGERWKQHIKTSLGIGTLANSTIHTHMSKHGLWNYTFEILEEVEKDKLNEREKYYIDFYESDKYGFNMRVG